MQPLQPPINSQSLRPLPSTPGSVQSNPTPGSTPNVQRRTEGQRESISIPPESATTKMSFKEKIFNYFSKPQEVSKAREEITKILFPNQKIDPGTRLSETQLKEAETLLKKNPELLMPLKRYVEERNQEIAQGGLTRKISHFAASLWGTSITAKAEEMIQSVEKHFNDTIPAVDYSRAAFATDFGRTKIPFHTVSEMPLEVSIGNSKIVSFTGFLAETDPSQPGKGVPEGMGLAKLADGRECYGNFKNGKFFEGEIHDRGTVSHGKFEDGLFMGKGILQFSDGTMLIGNFEKGEMIGDTKTYRYPNGQSLEVKFKDGVDQEGKFKGPDGREMKVFYENGKMTPESIKAMKEFPRPPYEIKQLRNGSIETGNFINGKLHGKGKVKMPGGAELSGTFVNGKISGRTVLKLSDETI